ncbi:MAG TPA: methionyl-tRNA formyltransferase [Bacteroidales bacterium]|nr:MAG: methionyl-tRNA formyltransferase [Bacteroidetes bacterium GWF2_33_38]HBF87348.1 methionyl-tRNA formyltransferase [Bacteroidales bacterium]
MKKKKLRILFMGTPEYAAEVLRKIITEGHEIVGIVTAPDKPAGRGLKLKESEVKLVGVENNLKILQPTNLKDENFIAELKSINADLQIVVAFRMLPEIVWSMPKYGTINLHASILPQYRGAAPINWAIINGEKETGVTTFFIEKEIDTGKIIFTEKLAIDSNDNAGSLHDKLMYIGAELIHRTITKIEENDIVAVTQTSIIRDSSILKSAPKIFKETCKINWNKTSVEIRNLVRGLSPYPVAWCEITDAKGKQNTMKIFEVELVENIGDKTKTGENIISDNKTFLYVKTADGYLSIKNLQLSGKNRVEIGDFLRGFNVGGMEFVR